MTYNELKRTVKPTLTAEGNWFSAELCSVIVTAADKNGKLLDKYTATQHNISGLDAQAKRASERMIRDYKDAIISIHFFN
jgi:hypothetical protein